MYSLPLSRLHQSAPKADATTAFAKELIVPFWLVRPTGDKERANMHRSTVVYKTSMATGKEEGTCDPVLVPVLQNTRPLKEGEELLIYNGDLEVPTHSMPQVPAITQSPNKKRTAAPAPTTVQPAKKGGCISPEAVVSAPQDVDEEEEIESVGGIEF